MIPSDRPQANVRNICKRLEIGSSDNEIALELNVPFSMVTNIRRKKLLTMISDEYDYPLEHTNHMMDGRIRDCIHNDLKDKVISRWLGVDIERVNKMRIMITDELGI